jgi:hypothetical protein
MSAPFSYVVSFGLFRVARDPGLSGGIRAKWTPIFQKNHAPSKGQIVLMTHQPMPLENAP